MHLSDVLAWIDSHPNQPMIRGAKYKPKTIVVKINDSAGASGGGGAGSASPGISTREIHGGGGQVPQTIEEQKKEEQHSQIAAYQERAKAAQEQRARDLVERQSAEARATEERQQKTTTAVYEKGGAVIRETKSLSKDPIESKAELDRLAKQQPGSTVVQTESGEYVLIKSRGLNLENQSTLATINRNIEQEGGTGYLPTRVPQAGGGFLNIARPKDSVTTSEPVPTEGGEPGGTRFQPIAGRPTKYTAKVGEGTIIAEQPAYAYSINLSERITTGKPERQLSEKEAELYWKYHPRELSRGISEGFYEPQFIGRKGHDILAYEKIGKEEPSQVFPITYTDESGKPLVTITGKSEGAEYNIYGPSKPVSPVSLTPGEKPVEANKIFPFPLEAQKTKNIVQVAEEKSPLYPYLGGNPNPFREVTKSYVKSGVQIAIEAGVGLIGPQTIGITSEEKRKEFVAKFEQAYPKELQPLETPVPKLLSGELPVTPYGFWYDVRAGVYEGAVLLSGVPKIEALANVPKLLTKIPGAIKNAPEAISTFLKQDAKIPEAISTKLNPPKKPGMKELYELPPSKVPVSKDPSILKPDLDNLAPFFTETKVQLGTSSAIDAPNPLGKRGVLEPVEILPARIIKSYYPSQPIQTDALGKLVPAAKRTSKFGIYKDNVDPEAVVNLGAGKGELLPGKYNVLGGTFVRENIALGRSTQFPITPKAVPKPVEPDYLGKKAAAKRTSKFGIYKDNVDPEAVVNLGAGKGELLPGKYNVLGGTFVRENIALGRSTQFPITPKAVPKPVEPDYLGKKAAAKRTSKFGIYKDNVDPEAVVNLGAGKGELLPGKYNVLGGTFVRENIALGRSTQFPITPKAVPKLVKRDPFYIKSPITGRGEKFKGTLYGYSFQGEQIPLGTGLTKLSSEGKPTRFPKPKPKPSPKTEERISKGMITIMESKTKPTDFVSTKINLGTSKKIIQSKSGIVTTLESPKPKPRYKTTPEPFFPTRGGGVYDLAEPIRYPRTKPIGFPSFVLLPYQQNVYGEESIQNITPKYQQGEDILSNLQIKPKPEERLNTKDIYKESVTPKERPKTTPVITTKTQPITIQETPQKQTPKFSFNYDVPTPLKPRSKLTPIFREKQLEKQKQLEIPLEPKPEELKTKKIFVPIPKRERKTKKTPEEPKSAFDWKGGVPEFKIEGVYKKYDIIYGEKRIAKLSRQEQFGKPKRKRKAKTDLLGFPKTKKSKSNKWVF